jgi:hypothetical protein
MVSNTQWWNVLTIVHTESLRFETMERVAELTMQGHSATAISKTLSIPRKEVTLLQEDYRTALANDSEARDMARDHLNMMVKHYDSLIKKFYDLVDEIDTLDFGHQVAAQKNAALKAIAELEAKRLDALQKAGLLDSAELGDELAEAEEKRDILIDIIQNQVCPECRIKIAGDIARLSGHVPTNDVTDAPVYEHYQTDAQEPDGDDF